MDTNNVGYWTPVKWQDGSHKFAAAADNYFSYLGGRSVTCIRSENGAYICEKSKNPSRAEKHLDRFLTFLKVVSLVTVVVLIIFFIGKLISRAGKRYLLDTPTPPKNPPKTSPSDTDPTKTPTGPTESESDSSDSDLSSINSSNPSSSDADTPPDLLPDTAPIVRPTENKPPPKMCVLKAEYPNQKISMVETIRTVDTVARTIKIIGEEIRNLKNELKDLEGSDELSKIDQEKRREILTGKIERCRQMFAACRRFNGFDKPKKIKSNDYSQWLGSWYFRALIKDHFNRVPNHAQLQDYVEAYKIAVREFIASPVNFREQTIKCGAETTSFLRCGALYDPTNPYTHLSELRALRNRGNTAIQKKKEEIQAIQREHPNNLKVQATTEYALEQLDNIEETIRVREEILQRQALQIVWAQAEVALKKNNPFSDGYLRIAHLALLNEDNIGIDGDSGWYHHEGYEIQDMAAVYEFLHGRTIYFDGVEGSGPYIDNNGAIHLPQINGKDPSELVTLQAGFFNISIQGKSKGRLQQNINQQSSRKLGLKGKIPLTRPKKKICPSTVEHATLMHKKLEEEGYQTIISCLSGKDRTGWVAYQIVLDRIVMAGGKRPTGLKTPGYRLLQEVLKQNYGNDVLKVCKKWLNGVDTSERAKLGKKQAADLVKNPEALRGRKGSCLNLKEIVESILSDSD